jgi:hypothetical protein
MEPRFDTAARHVLAIAALAAMAGCTAAARSTRPPPRVSDRPTPVRRAVRGDVDGDGIPDVAVAEQARRVLVFRGGAGGLSSEPSCVFEPPSDGPLGGFGRWLALGDLDGDGRAEVVVGDTEENDDGSVQVGRVLLYRCAAPTAPWRVLAAPPDARLFGYQVFVPGDLSGDGIDDLVVIAACDGVEAGANTFADLAGNPCLHRTARAYVYRGGRDGVTDAARVTVTHRFSMSMGRGLGAAVAGAGDVDHDGLGDLFVRGTIVSSRASEPFVQTLVGSAALAEVGARGIVTGDFDRDGTLDLVGERVDQATQARQLVFVRDATAARTPPVIHLDPSRRILQGTVGWGADLASADINGDGFDDLLWGLPDSDNERGCVEVYLGGRAGLPARPSFTLGSPEGAYGFGACVVRAGDVDGDHIDDAVVCAPSWSEPDTPGSAYLVRGGRNSPRGIVLIGRGRAAGWGASAAGG